MVLNPASITGNPFPGLRPFLPEESHLFFGRERECREALSKLLKNRFVAVIGASGCGKTSLVNCGIISEIKKQSNSLLKIISFRPGNDPIGNMTNEFAKVIPPDRNADNKGRSFISNVKKDPDWITSAMKKLLIRPGEKALIMIDQFEDLFTSSLTERGFEACENASEFVTLLENAIKQISPEIYVVIALHSDYIGECAHYQRLTQIINNSNFLVPHFTRENYREAIEGPVKYNGAIIDPKLVDSLLADIGDKTDQLPVLQHTMATVWTHWTEAEEQDSPVSIVDYGYVGTMNEALSVHADKVYEELTLRGREICEKMFKAMTEKGSELKRSCHLTSLKAIGAITGCSGEELSDITGKFSIPSGSFISLQQNVTRDHDSIACLSYSSLTYQWDRLRKWIDDEAASSQIYLKLSEASAMYQQGKTSLLRPPDLPPAINWRDQYKPTLAWAKRYDPAFERVIVFLRTSEKSYLEQEAIRDRRHLNKNKRKRIIARILVLAAVISLGLMVYAFILKVSSERKRNEAEVQKSEASAKALVAERNIVLAGKKVASADSNAAIAFRKEREANQLLEISDMKRSVAEKDAAEVRKQKYMAMEQTDSARKALIISDMNAKSLVELKNEAIRKRMISLGKSMSLKSLQLTGKKDLQTLLAYQAYIFNKSNGGSANDADIFSGLYNVAKQYGNVNCKTVTGHAGEIKSIAFIPGKREYFTSGTDGKVCKWNIDGNNPSLQVIYSDVEIINVLSVSPDAAWLAMGGQNSRIKVIPLKDNNMSYELNGHTGSIKSLIFSYDGKYLYSSSLDGKVLKWDLSTRSSINISSGMMQITSIDLSSDNKYIAGVSNDGKAMVWNPEVTSDNFRIGSVGKVIRTVKFKPEENKLAIGYSDGYVELWDLATRRKFSEFVAHNSDVSNIKFNPKRSQIATTGNDKTIRIWDVNDMVSLPLIFDDNSGFVVEMEFSPDGQVLVSGTSEGINNLSTRPAYSDILAKDLCSVVSRNFTFEEWQAYVGKDIMYEKTCPESEFRIKVNIIK